MQLVNLTQIIQLSDGQTVGPGLVISNLIYAWEPQRKAGLVLVTSNDLGCFYLIQRRKQY